jgi:hypothetical protein
MTCVGGRDSQTQAAEGFLRLPLGRILNHGRPLLVVISRPISESLEPWADGVLGIRLAIISMTAHTDFAKRLRM